jgi:hypothetical protein
MHRQMLRPRLQQVQAGFQVQGQGVTLRLEEPLQADELLGEEVEEVVAVYGVAEPAGDLLEELDTLVGLVAVV